jgi:hypothetical protein
LPHDPVHAFAFRAQYEIQAEEPAPKSQLTLLKPTTHCLSKTVDAGYLDFQLFLNPNYCVFE